MKKINFLLLCLFAVIVAACTKEEVEKDARIIEISAASNMTLAESQNIEVRIEKPTPCHTVASVNKTTSGNTINYDIILQSDFSMCATVIAEETVTINFQPEGAGQYLLKFYVNGKYHTSKTVSVTE
jgi:hypothetical protein